VGYGTVINRYSTELIAGGILGVCFFSIPFQQNGFDTSRNQIKHFGTHSDLIVKYIHLFIKYSGGYLAVIIWGSNSRYIHQLQPLCLHVCLVNPE
jgi:hypothetical protein